MDRFLNLGLLANPMNWLIIWLMLAIAVVGLKLVLPAPGLHTGTIAV